MSVECNHNSCSVHVHHLLSPSLDVIHGWRSVIHGCHSWMEKCHPLIEVSSVDVIHGWFSLLIWNEKTIEQFLLGLWTYFRNYGWLLSRPSWKFLLREYSNQVAPPSFLLKIGILSWNLFWWILFGKKWPLGGCGSIFCPNMGQKCPRTELFYRHH